MVQIASLGWGVVAFILMMFALLPFLAPMNRFNLPFAGIGLILSLVALATAKATGKGLAIVAFVCNGVAVAIAAIRLALGGGIL